MTAAAGAAALTIGTLADAAEHVGGRLVPLFRARHPHEDVTIHEADPVTRRPGFAPGWSMWR